MARQIFLVRCSRGEFILMVFSNILPRFLRVYTEVLCSIENGQSGIIQMITLEEGNKKSPRKDILTEKVPPVAAPPAEEE